MSEAPLIQAEGLVKTYRTGRRQAHVLRGVDLSLARGEIVGLVGESGCGKSTLGRCLLRLEELDAGRVLLDGVDLSSLSRRALRRARQRMQLVFQDPFSSLDPRLPVEAIVGEPLATFGLARGRAARRAAVTELLEQVGLPADVLGRYPHEFSGGQRQRLGIARALAARPELIVADEPVSALDVSVQAQIINLLGELQRRARLTYLFISHDLRVVRHLCHRVVVMYLGRIVEQFALHRGASEGREQGEFALHRGASEGRGQGEFEPAHPYTRALLAAVPTVDGQGGHVRVVLPGEAPSPEHPPSGCPFHPRCALYAERRGRACVQDDPALLPLSARDGHRVACHEAGDASGRDSG